MVEVGLMEGAIHMVLEAVEVGWLEKMEQHNMVTTQELEVRKRKVGLVQLVLMERVPNKVVNSD